MKVSAELVLEIDRLRANAQAAEEHIKRVGATGKATATAMDRSWDRIGSVSGGRLRGDNFRALNAGVREADRNLGKFAAGLGGTFAALDGNDTLRGVEKLFSGAGERAKFLTGAAAGAGEGGAGGGGFGAGGLQRAFGGA
jgi:hypothetical protein